MGKMAKAFNYWKLAIWKGWSGVTLLLIATCPSVVLNWDTMTANGKFLAVIGLVAAVIKYIDGFLDQTFSRLLSGKPLVQLPYANGNGGGNKEGDTIHMTKTETAQTDITVAPKP